MLQLGNLTHVCSVAPLSRLSYRSLSTYIIRVARATLDVAGGVLGAAVDLVLAADGVRHRAATVAALLQGAAGLAVVAPAAEMNFVFYLALVSRESSRLIIF